MTRKIYITANDPPSAEDLATAAGLDAPEVISLDEGWDYPAALLALGIDTPGYHEIADPALPVPDLIEKRKAKLQMLATPWPLDAPTGTLLDAVEAAIAAAADPALTIEWGDAIYVSRTRDLVKTLQLGLGVSDAMVDALFIAADARP